MNKRPGFDDERLKRTHRKVIWFNSHEMEAIEKYCKRYKITNRSRFIREAIITKILNKFDVDHPTLF